MSRPTRAAGWFKSSFSGGGNDQCVECRIVADSGILVRNSKDAEVRPLYFTTPAWAAFVKGVRSGKLDPPG